jgi:prostaglandin-E synthase
MPSLPTVIWAQRRDKLFLTIDLQDVKDQTFKLDNSEDGTYGKLSFSGKAGTDAIDYVLELDLNGAIVAADSKVSITPRHIFIVIEKVEEGHWERLTHGSQKGMTHIKCDWDKWADEDEEDEASAVDMGDMANFNSFDEGEGGAGFPGGGFGGEEDEDDSDNEDLPDLVK